MLTHTHIFLEISAAHARGRFEVLLQRGQQPAALEFLFLQLG